MAKRKKHDDAPAVPSKPREPEAVIRYITVQLDPVELAERAREAAKLMAERDRDETAYKDAAAKARQLVAAQDILLRRLNRIVVAGEETRPVKCKIRIDRRAGSADTVRLDTGDVVETRALTAAERQFEIPGAEGEDE